jgi:hypothetical protein
MNEIIEGTAVVKHVEKPKLRYQVTIKAKTDHKLSQVANPIIEAEGVTAEAACFALSNYLKERVNRSEVKYILAIMIRGYRIKPKKIASNRFVITFLDGDVFVEEYTLTFMEL